MKGSPRHICLARTSEREGRTSCYNTVNLNLGTSIKTSNLIRVIVRELIARRFDFCIKRSKPI